MSIPNNLLPFLEYAFPERIEPIFHNDSDNQLFNGRDEVDEPIGADKAHIHCILKPILE